MDEKKFCIIVFALFMAIIAISLAQNAQETADINNIFAIVVNNTNLAPSSPGHPPGTGERVKEVTYWANDSPIEVFVFAHAMAVGDNAEIHLFINGTKVADTSGRPLGGAETSNKTIIAMIPKGANYSFEFNNAHHYEWREYPVLSGKNGTLSINQSFVGSSFNSTYAATTAAYNANYSAQTFPNSTIISSNNSMNNMKVNKTGDNMTGRLCVGNCSLATLNELVVVENSGDSVTSGAFIRLETNNSAVGNAFFGARYKGNRSDNATPVLKNDVLFRLLGIGTKTNNTYSGAAAEIRFVVEDNFTNTKTPGRVEFWTVNNITTTQITKKWEIAANGSFLPSADNQYDIGNNTNRVKNLTIALTAEGSTLDAVCYDGIKLFYNPGLATCTASREDFKHNITPANYNPLNLKMFNLVTYDYVVSYPHVDETNDSVSYTQKTVKRYGLIAEQVQAIDPMLVSYDEGGNITGVHYEDLAAYLLNVTQKQQLLLDKICTTQPLLCQ